ncbi:MAG: transposase [Betaproteobacteria bacterium]
MGRLACTSQPGVALHLVQRSARPQAPEAYLERLGVLAARHGCALHAYALMGNHAHLLATPARAEAAAAFMEGLGGDFDATPVHARRYLLACMRYIELNPVRAGLTRDPAEYRWSSHRANALGETDRLLSPHPLYFALGRGATERCAAYRESFAGRIAPVPTSVSRSPLSAARRAR